MARVRCVFNMFLLMLFASSSIPQTSAYYEYTVENDRICSTLAKKRKVELGYNERSGLAVQETRYFNHWPGSYEFNCRFELKAIAKDGILAVIQNLNLRRNETSGECIDFVQFKPDLGAPSEKFCGVISTLQPHAEPDNPEQGKNSFIDIKGELEVQIVIKKLALQQNEKIDLDIVFTSYKLCAKNRKDYSSCGSEICIWKGFFDDGRVNCPLDDCKDESSCAVNFNGVVKKEISTSPMYAIIVLAVCILSVATCLYFAFRKSRSTSRLNRPQMELNTFDLEEQLSPSAPPLAETPKDRPPPYESLFPNDCY